MNVRLLRGFAGTAPSAARLVCGMFALGALIPGAAFSDEPLPVEARVPVEAFLEVVEAPEVSGGATIVDEGALGILAFGALKEAALIEAAPAKARWTPEQATGEPDTLVAGDQYTAWASSTQDGAEEWLELEYAETFQPTKVLVYETYNPGAVVKLVAYTESGMQSEIWSGADPVVVKNGMGVAEIPFAAAVKTNKIRLYIDSKAVAGWNEIDAVGLVDGEGKTHWAVKAAASSTYGVADAAGGEAAPAAIILGGEAPPEVFIFPEPELVLPDAPLPAAPDPRDARIEALEILVKDLQAQIDALKERIDAESAGEPKPK
jgi:hypothetical protein